MAVRECVRVRRGATWGGGALTLTQSCSTLWWRWRATCARGRALESTMSPCDRAQVCVPCAQVPISPWSLFRLACALSRLPCALFRLPSPVCTLPSSVSRAHRSLSMQPGQVARRKLHEVARRKLHREGPVRTPVRTSVSPHTLSDAHYPVHTLSLAGFHAHTVPAIYRAHAVLEGSMDYPLQTSDACGRTQ